MVGRLGLARHAVLAQGTVVRSVAGAVRIGHDSAVLENSTVVGRPGHETSIGRRTVFGHRCVIAGATVGDLCEIGNGSLLMPGVVLGDHCLLGEGTLVPADTVVPDGAVLVGRPGRRIRTATDEDRARVASLRGGHTDLSGLIPSVVDGPVSWGHTMGNRYEFRGTRPTVHPTAIVFDSAEITGDVHVGARTIIGAGVRIIGDSHGPVRIGADVQILENTVLHLLPDNELVLEDGVIVGPACMIHGCRLGAGTVVEPGANVCDWVDIGAGSVVRAGSLVPQRAHHPAGVVVEGFPAKVLDGVTPEANRPSWAFADGDLETLRPVD